MEENTMKVKLFKLLTLFALCMLITACNKQNETPTPSVSTTENRQEFAANNTTETEITGDIQESGEEYTAILYMEQEVYYTITLKKGRVIQTLNKEGYEFAGYYTEDDVNYVTKDGKVIREYHGVEELNLYPKFIPLDYDIRFFSNGKEIGIAKRTCSYDMNMVCILPFGEVLGDECVIGFQDETGNIIIDTNTDEIYLKDLQNILDKESREIKLEVIKTLTKYQESRLDTYEISDSGFFKQKLNIEGKAYDLCSLKDKVDVQALKKLHYNQVEIELICQIQEEDTGDQYIRLYPKKTTNKRDDYIMDSGKIENMTKEEDTQYTMKEIVPIEKLESGEIYIYYNAGGIWENNWISRAMTISLTFQKE